jgi:hypothetical protein
MGFTAIAQPDRGPQGRRLGDVCRTDFTSLFQIGNRPGHLEQAVIAARGQPQAIAQIFQQFAGCSPHLAIALDTGMIEAGVAAPLPRLLGRSRRPHGGGGRGRTFRRWHGSTQCRQLGARHLDVQVDAVE